MAWLKREAHSEEGPQASAGRPSTNRKSPALIKAACPHPQDLLRVCRGVVDDRVARDRVHDVALKRGGGGGDVGHATPRAPVASHPGAKWGMPPGMRNMTTLEHPPTRALKNALGAVASRPL